VNGLFTTVAGAITSLSMGALAGSDLQGMPLFEGLSEDERERLACKFEERTAREGDRFTTEGASGYLFFVIVEGNAEARIDDRTVGELGPGDFFGEVAMLGETGRRMAAVVAASDMRVGVLFGTEFRQMEAEFPQVVERLETAMAERLAIAGLG
jgi:CRP-like cAMP-binding protein